MLRPIQQGRWSVDSAIRPKFVSLRLLLLLLLVVVVLLLLLLILMMLLILLSPQTTHRMAATCNFAFLDAALCCRNEDLTHLQQPWAPAYGCICSRRPPKKGHEGCGRPGHRHHNIHNQGAAV